MLHDLKVTIYVNLSFKDKKSLAILWLFFLCLIYYSVKFPNSDIIPYNVYYLAASKVESQRNPFVKIWAPVMLSMVTFSTESQTTLYLGVSAAASSFFSVPQETQVITAARSISFFMV